MEKVEKVARAICAANGDEPDKTLKADVFDVDSPFNGKPYWRKYEKEARVFLAAQEALAAE